MTESEKQYRDALLLRLIKEGFIDDSTESEIAFKSGYEKAINYMSSCKEVKDKEAITTNKKQKALKNTPLENLIKMDVKELSTTLNRMKYGINYKEEMLSNSEIWKAIEKYYIKDYYNLDAFNADRKNIKEFHKKGYDLYNRDFLKIKLSESICAEATPFYNNLKFVLSNCI